MMKYIKVAVPDDFSEETESFNIGDQTFPIWKPVYTDVLDHGHIGLVDFLGADQSIVNAARVSYQKGTTRTSNNRGLIRYMMKHLHMTPFEMCSFVFHVKAPIFVFRQWHRHRTAHINEMSGRYSVLEETTYFPSFQNLAPQSKTNNQGRVDETLTENDYFAVRAIFDHVYREAFIGYNHVLGPKEIKDESGAVIGTATSNPPDAIEARRLFVEQAAVNALRKARDLNSEKVWTEEDIQEVIEDFYIANDLAIVSKEFPGIARELARMLLPVATYSEMYWKCDLRNIFNFIRLRADPHAQYEIRVYAEEMYKLIEPFVPLACEAFNDYIALAKTLSKYEVDIVKGFVSALTGEDKIKIEASMLENGSSKREIGEFFSTFS